ncbi:hypothetical protein AALO_G00301500 [Alosa alosa]|uniref:Uncharacterized protein n=1 Tax=Alosa alosa TaxID=278164 RepID=A0AAV6FHT7_9TELE|nr:hypothetical protein AALO_G00301500 [Alosa alosa]
MACLRRILNSYWSLQQASSTPKVNCMTLHHRRKAYLPRKSLQTPCHDSGGKL